MKKKNFDDTELEPTTSTLSIEVQEIDDEERTNTFLIDAQNSLWDAEKRNAFWKRRRPLLLLVAVIVGSFLCALLVVLLPRKDHVSSSPSATETNLTLQMKLTRNHCGCMDCTNATLNRLVGNPAYSCGDRITWLLQTQPSVYPTEADACRRVALEFACECGMCDPARCNIQEKEVINTSNDNYGLGTTSQDANFDPTYLLNKTQYCFPDRLGDRLQFDMWNGSVIIQAKHSPNDTTIPNTPKRCGPGDNVFDSSLVSTNAQRNELTLRFRGGKATEVRVLPGSVPFGYGTYTFSLKSIKTYYRNNVQDPSNISVKEELPQELVLGFFTWDDHECYDCHENYNHEVDVEISRWNCPMNADVQFVVQPWDGPGTIYRFFSGARDNNSPPSYRPMGHEYSFSWYPGRIHWSTTAGGGKSRTLTTDRVVKVLNTTDYIQCLPDRDLEVRINLWNMVPGFEKNLSTNIESVEVVIDRFTFTPTTLPGYLNAGRVCSKNCQCQSNLASCVNNICTPRS